MSVRKLPQDHPPVPEAKIGVLMIALGTPDAPDPSSVRRYLKQFLWDPRVVEVSRPLWWLILHGVILVIRPRRSARAYSKVWDTDLNESPLRTYTRLQAEKIADRFSQMPNVVVDWGMRYGNPSIASRVRALIEAGCSRILVAPLYPQYAAATTATANDETFRALIEERWQPAIRTLPSWYDEPAYIQALAASVRDHLAGLDWQPEAIVASFHGLPQRYLELGDPYYCHCAKTARLLREELGLGEDEFIMSFQSRVGRDEWLRPYTDEVFAELGQRGVKRIATITPGFSADCLETLEEIAMEGEEQFHAAGGEHFSFIPSLNDSEPHMDLLDTLIRRELQGWI